MKKTRDWGAAVEINSSWKQPGRIMPLRPSFYYHENSLFPCDTMGFRIPTGFKNVKDKYAQCEGTPKVFCFGGSTTFGIYGSYDQSYPAQLEKIYGSPIFNLGLQELDIHANIYTLIDALYQGLRPDVAVFYDGVNEKNGFKQAMSGRKSYRMEHVQYQGFVDMNKAASLRYRLTSFMKNFVKPKDEGSLERPDTKTIETFANEQSKSYLNSKNFIRELGQRFNFKTLFLLQPTIYDFWGRENDLRASYLQSLYNTILEQDPNIIDMRSVCSLEPNMFYDMCHLSPEGNASLAKAVHECLIAI